MMQITNTHNLPQSLFDAICTVNAKYDKGEADLSVTQLIDSARISQLRKQHQEDIIEDASDMLWRFFGSLAHETIANMDDFGVLKEERLYTKLEGKVISGSPDLFDGEKVVDYKITSIYKVKNGVDISWERQTNIYRYLLVDHKWDPLELEIVAILRDAHADDEKVAVLPVKMWSLKNTEEYIRQRIQSHIQAETTLPLCSEEERWHSPRKFAVMKTGNKRALKLFDIKIEANLYMKQVQEKEKKAIYIEERPGEDKRCKLYCNVYNFCDQAKL